MANNLRLHGITADTLKPGDHVIVVGHPAREERRVYMVSITRPSDKWEWRRRGRHYTKVPGSEG